MPVNEFMNNVDSCVTYYIDKENRLTFVDDKWYEFALDNKAAQLTRPVVVNKSLFSFISDESTIHLYKMLIERIRKEQETLGFAFRCDSPDRRRFMEMVLFPLSNNSVGFRSCIIKEELRKTVALLDAGGVRSGDLLKICSWCKKIELDHSVWVEVEQAVESLGLFNVVKLPYLTHGMCPSCHDGYIQELFKNDA